MQKHIFQFCYKETLYNICCHKSFPIHYSLFVIIRIFLRFSSVSRSFLLRLILRVCDR